jgi:hypothetical protein
MKSRTWLAISAISLLTMRGVAWSQSSDVTFTVPLNLSQLSPDVRTVTVFCEVKSPAIVAGGSARELRRFTPVGGRVQATATVRVAINGLDNSKGTAATYRCELKGLRSTSGLYIAFSANASDSAFRLLPDPAPLTGTFNWLDAPPPANVAPGNVTTTSPGGVP